MSLITHYLPSIARARQGLLPGQLTDNPDYRRQALAGHVAGRVAVRAPRPGRLKEAGDHADGLSARAGAQPAVPRLADRQYVQLGAASLHPRQPVIAGERQ